MPTVLVLFQSDTEVTEQLALAVAVGAVEAEAAIRLRRLASANAAEIAHKGYGKLQEADLVWADTIAVGLESPTANPGELDSLLQQLSALGPAKLAGKQAWTFGPTGLTDSPSQAQSLIEAALEFAGVTLMSDIPVGGDTAAEPLAQMKRAGHFSAAPQQ
jgi:flavorubredoxin